MKKPIALLTAAAMAFIAACFSGCFNFFGSGSSSSSSRSEAKATPDTPDKAETEAQDKTDEQEPLPESYKIEGFNPINQTTLKAGCETYAATMLLQKLGFDVDEFEIADNYLIERYISYGEDGEKRGPDMHSAFAGSAYAGWGVYAPAMAKSMNNYLADQKSDLKAYAYEDIPMETLIRDYIVNDVPVMVWATTNMQEPYVFDTWVVDYVDENAKAQIGDKVDWYMHQHCLVLMGYDKDNYYFADSTDGIISCFEKSLCEQRYEEMGSQCIVVQ